MQIVVSANKYDLGMKAARHGGQVLRQAIQERGQANMIVATGASQFEMLGCLVEIPGIDWGRVTGFHLDEYIGLPMSHPASFRRYLKERFVNKIALHRFYYVNTEGKPEAECKGLNSIIRKHPVDVAFVGIGENGHLAFNDPPANFTTEDPYIVVNLDDACRRQQLGEGWFPNLDAVPKQALSMSIRQIMKAKCIVGSVPDQRKAKAVQASVEGAVSPMVPASILQEHANCTLFLDPDSAALLHEKPAPV